MICFFRQSVKATRSCLSICIPCNVIMEEEEAAIFRIPRNRGTAGIMEIYP